MSALPETLLSGSRRGRVLVPAIVLALSGLLGPFAAPGVHAQGTGRVVLGFAPGGAIDTMSRLVADRLREGLGHPFIADNRAGAEGRIAIDAVKSASPDGKTLLFTPIANICIYPHTQKNLPYDPQRDLTPVALVGLFPIGLAVGPMTPAKTVAEFVAWAKANPRDATFGTPGNGNIPHFTGITFARAAGIELTNVPFKGTPPAVTALLGGQIAAVVSTIGDFVPQARAGKLRILAHASGARSPIAPDVPTFKELGIDLLANGWYGLFAPAGTPANVIDQLNRIVIDAQRAGDFKARMESLALEVRLTTPAEFAALVREDYERWGKVIRASGFKALE